ncbi:NADPH-dependent FMN reductase [Alkalicoccus urumqiensis]|uniref:NADPH-dependent FMN reductase n=1 Tax=Alkalicoccus urumqiensis TaxID=1548213 RepID=A0A2P6MLU4_ALKUR|nr:NAD(P)H-dependent oxidoreductase [Alkalicoccus urumqiensis]PRO67242.1 NADPH-dependent FMN reductase [Alkalicoccus urumqiensis]
MKIAALVGSKREDSYNHRIALFMQERYRDQLDIDIKDIASLPHFDQDDEENPPEVVQQFKKEIREADGILIVTPEYNHSVPGMLKNALDWCSRVDKVMTGKPVLIAGASPGFLGTVRCQVHLRQILAAPGMAAKVLPGNEVFIGAVHQKMDDEGSITDTGTVEFLDMVVGNYVNFAELERKKEELAGNGNR